MGAKPLAALLNSRQMLRVMKEYNKRGITTTSRTDYLNSLRVIAHELYPEKVD